jgi:hypothetical protein
MVEVTVKSKSPSLALPLISPLTRGFLGKSSPSRSQTWEDVCDRPVIHIERSDRLSITSSKMRVRLGAQMPAKDIYHNAVKSALVKDGWTITADPYRIVYEDAELYADLAAERPIAAERDEQKIVVEIKSFVGRSLMYDFHNALGQYMVYRRLIELTQPDYKLYLAIDDITNENLFQRKSIQAVIEDSNLLLMVVDMEKEIIVRWTN